MAETDNNFIKKMRVGDSQYEQLCLEGIENLQQLSGDIWTDFNEHDPGVTILENVVFALTEIINKTDLPVEDLLTHREGQILKSGYNGMFVASEILTTNPVTVNDYRKFFFDKVVNIKNVWIKLPGEGNDFNNMNPVKGLYHFYIELYDFNTDPKLAAKERERIIKEVKDIFNSHRNLCENLGSITVCDPLKLKMGFEITINDNVSAEDVMADLFFNVDGYITEKIKYYSLDQLQKDMDTDDIFEGPHLENGFIKSSELKDKLNQIELPELIKLAVKIDGIKSISSLSLYQDKGTEYVKLGNESLTITEEFVPMLVFPTSTENLIFHQNGINFAPNLKDVKGKLSYKMAINYGNFRSISKSVNELSIPSGTFHDIAYYYPVRYQFPVNYGIGKLGLPKGLPAKRYAQANQLKAFLLPFDQLMANFLALLSNLNTLFETTEKGHSSNFYQVLDQMPELLNLVEAQNDEPASIKKWEQTLKSINEDLDNNSDSRLNKVADDLLARFSEEIPAYFLNMIDHKIYGEESAGKFKLLDLKRKLLQNYSSISYNRNKGNNYTIKVKSPSDFKKAEHRNALVEKISLLTGIKNSHFRSLSEEVSQNLKIYDIWDDSNEINFILDVILQDEESRQLYLDDIEIVDKQVKDLYNSFFYKGFSETLLEDCLQLGIHAENYEIHESGGRKGNYYHVHFKDNKRRNLIHIAHSEYAAQKAVEYAVNFLTKINQDSEGMFLMEHILLLPPLEGDHFGFSINLNIGKPTENLQIVHTKIKPAKKRNADVITLIQSLTILKKIQIDEKHSAHGSYVLEFRDDKDEIIGISEQTFTNLTEAGNYKTDILSCLSVENEIPFTCNYQAYYAGTPVDESFFSFRMTFILPSWPVRFQEDIFRQKFDAIVFEQTPAHIVTHNLWLKLPMIQEFEKLYYKWFRLNGQRSNDAEIMAVSYDLIHFLQKEGI